MAVELFFSQDLHSPSDPLRQFRRGINIEKHFRVLMPDGFHVFFSHHHHAALIDGIKENLNIFIILQHTDQTEDLIFLKVVEQAACSDQERLVRIG